MRFISHILPVLVSILVLSGSVTGSAQTTNGITISGRPAPTDNHVLRSGDRISYVIKNDPFYKNSDAFSVEISDFSVRFPVTHDPNSKGLAVTVSPAGKTIRDVRMEVSTLLRRDYYNRVEVEILLQDKQARIGKVQIFDSRGAIIDSTFDIDLDNPPRLTELLSKANPQFKDPQWLDRNRARLHRPGFGAPREYDWQNLLTSGDKSSDPVLRDGDKIQVRERGRLGW